jgi:hypothetical protein
MAKYVLQVEILIFGPFGATNKTPQDGEIADRTSLKDIATQQNYKLLVHVLGNYKNYI